MSNPDPAACKRPYTLGKRLLASGQKREAILAAARRLLESNGFFHLTMDGLARESGISRQTVHNLFGTKTAILEALFDQLAIAGGMESMRSVMQQPDPMTALTAFVQTFTKFWRRDRILIRRIHGIAAIDPEFGAAVDARNQRRHFAATRLVDRLNPAASAVQKSEQIVTLYAITSFEFYDTLATVCLSEEEAMGTVLNLTGDLWQPEVGAHGQSGARK